ncbi:RHS repeat-associated core domain-containing protein [Clostridium sp. JNZ J1-5]
MITYYYDELNQLTREDNQVSNKTITYSYDAGGNILSKAEYSYTTGDLGTATSTISYGYTDSNWKDKLTNFNGKEITYDAIGNPLTYDGYTFTWEQGRQLLGINGNSKDISFKYNVDGIRTEKTVNGVTTKYHLVGDRVTFEENGTDKIYYTYDSAGQLISMNLTSSSTPSINGEYYYIRNAQGDIIGLYDKNGTQVVSYTYDSWGKLISIDGSLKDSVGVKNPYRYRGYRYDTETGLYYLQSRYYSLEWGRFINADGIVGQTGELLAHNMFAYCGSNPINREDANGYAWEFIEEFVAQVSNAINAIKPAYTFSGGVAVADGPLPFGDVIGLAVATVTTLGAVGYGTYKTISSSRTKAVPIAHGNSKKSKRPQHGYEIYNKKTGDVVKVGISGGRIRLDRKSYRAEKQVRAFNRRECGDIYDSRIMAHFADRQSALEWEVLNSQFRYAQGHSMKYHLRPGFDNWWDTK